MIKFIPFYFEGNQRWGFFETPDEVIDLLKYYDYDVLRRAKVYEGTQTVTGQNTKLSQFGFYSEYRGDYTLGEWIDDNNQGCFFNLKEERLKKIKKLNERL